MKRYGKSKSLLIATCAVTLVGGMVALAANYGGQSQVTDTIVVQSSATMVDSIGSDATSNTPEAISIISAATVEVMPAQIEDVGGVVLAESLGGDLAEQAMARIGTTPDASAPIMNLAGLALTQSQLSAVHGETVHGEIIQETLFV